MCLQRCFCHIMTQREQKEHGKLTKIFVSSLCQSVRSELSYFPNLYLQVTSPSRTLIRIPLQSSSTTCQRWPWNSILTIYLCPNHRQEMDISSLLQPTCWTGFSLHPFTTLARQHNWKHSKPLSHFMDTKTTSWPKSLALDGGEGQWLFPWSFSQKEHLNFFLVHGKLQQEGKV